MFYKKVAFAVALATLPVAAEATVHTVVLNATYNSGAALAGQAIKAEFAYDDAAIPTFVGDPFGDPDYRNFIFNGNAVTTPIRFTDSTGIKTIVIADVFGNASSAADSDSLTINNGLAANTGYYEIYFGSSGLNFITNGLPTALPALSNGVFGVSITTPRGTASVASLSFDAPSAVPEPASWAMMVGGFGLLGRAMRQRRKVALTIA